jgi:hypothetical protein
MPPHRTVRDEKAVLYASHTHGPCACAKDQDLAGLHPSTARSDGSRILQRPHERDGGLPTGPWREGALGEWPRPRRRAGTAPCERQHLRRARRAEESQGACTRAARFGCLPGLLVGATAPASRWAGEACGSWRGIGCCAAAHQLQVRHGWGFRGAVRRLKVTEQGTNCESSSS